MNRQIVAAAVLTTSVLAASAAVDTTNPPPSDVLLIDDLGHVVRVPTNELHRSLLPPPDIGLRRQTPDPIEGANVPDEILQRIEQAKEGVTGVRFFPPVPPRLMPYLASEDEFGDTVIRPGPLIDIIPLDPIVQGVKYRLADNGLRYSLEQTLTYVSMSDVMKGDNNLGFYTFDLRAKWAIFDAPSAGTAGWVTTQVETKTGLGSAGDNQDPKSNLGTVTTPTFIWSSDNNFRVPELAWQESLRDGEIVVVAGMVSQQNYLDGNAAAHTGRGEFLNSALVHSQVLPLGQYNFGLNLQWQPTDEWYGMFGASAGDATAGEVPWTNLDSEHWSLVWELGYAPKDVLGLGPGIYRLQPFVAKADGPTQGGLCFNLQQRLGAHTPFAYFGRFGFGGEEAGTDASAQIGTGFVMQAPLEHLGLVPRLKNDLLGVAFVWSQPAATTKTVHHENEYVLETFYTLQLTPTIKLEPDLQVVWDPAFNPDAGPATVVQLQLNLAW